MIRLETFGSAESARTCGNIFRGRGGLTRRIRFGVGRIVADWFDPNIHRGIGDWIDNVSPSC